MIEEPDDPERLTVQEYLALSSDERALRVAALRLQQRGMTLREIASCLSATYRLVRYVTQPLDIGRGRPVTD